MDYLLSPLNKISGIGEKTFENYKKLLKKEEPRVVDLLFHFPNKILYRKKQHNLKLINDGDLVIIDVVVDTIDYPFNKKQPCKIICSNDTGFITILYFNYFLETIKKTFIIGSKIILSGRAKKNNFGGEITITHPDYVNNKFIPEEEQIYPLTYKIINRTVRSLVQKILEKMENVKLYDVIGDNKELSFKQCIYGLHNAKNEFDLAINSKYMEQLALYEILAEQIALKEFNKDNNNIRIPVEKTFELKKYYLENLPFKLTKSQEKAIYEIENDIFSNKNMLRLLQGDVGSGKTIVAFLTMLPFIENKKQIAIMCPTSILAKQHYDFLKKNNINTELLTSGSKQKKKILEKIENGDIDVVVGTHAIFQDKVKFKELRYVVIDEQHRFGVAQRLELISRGYKTDTLIMSATPIPRTLSLSIYNGIDLSVIDEKPKNRKEIITISINKNRSDELIQKIRNKIAQNEKVYWICPLINEGNDENLMSVNERYEILKKHFKDEIDILSGELLESEKNKILEKFSTGDTKILVSTTVVEVGIDVPDATIIIIENPERFGLSQIHQLRGRVGRGEKQSYCILFYESESINFKKRMKILKNTSDGFKIAEEDLKLRGKGEILGDKQSGIQMRIANLEFHYHLFSKANKILEKVTNYDNLLKIFGYNKNLKGKLN